MASGLSPGVGEATIPPDPMTPPSWMHTGTIPKTVDGSMAGRRLPKWMDALNGELSVLSMFPKDTEGKFPDNPWLIRRSIEEEVGCIEDARPEAKGSRYILKVRQAKQVEKLLKLQKLSDGTMVTVQFHERLNVRKCIVLCHHGLTMSDEAVLEELRSQRVIEVKRYTKPNPKDKSKPFPTPTLLLTIQGTTIPEFLYFGYHRVKTRTYYPSPLQCGNCHRFAHTKRDCQVSPICPECSLEHEFTSPCLAEALCVNCKGPHSARSRDCPIKVAESKIVRIKVDEDVPYPEARKRFESRQQNNLQHRLETGKVTELVKQLESKDQEIRKLRGLLEKLIREVAELKNNRKLQPSLSNIDADLFDEDLSQTTSENEPQSMDVDEKQNTKSTKRRQSQSNSNPDSPSRTNAPPSKKSLDNVADLANTPSHQGKADYNREDISPIRGEKMGKAKGRHQH